jgi:hypothetical protein
LTTQRGYHGVWNDDETSGWFTECVDYQDDAGEHITVFVEAPPDQNGGDEAVAKTNRGAVSDATVFITPGSCTLHRADQVHCRIRDVEDNYVKALALYRLS